MYILYCAPLVLRGVSEAAPQRGLWKAGASGGEAVPVRSLWSALACASALFCLHSFGAGLVRAEERARVHMVSEGLEFSPWYLFSRPVLFSGGSWPFRALELIERE